jgi:hypothetical protein
VTEASAEVPGEKDGHCLFWGHRFVTPKSNLLAVGFGSIMPKEAGQKVPRLLAYGTAPGLPLHLAEYYCNHRRTRLCENLISQ